MTEEGRPTGISREDAKDPGRIVDFEGQRAEVFHFSEKSSMFAARRAQLVLDRSDERLVLWGYFRGDEFMEVERERLES
jgi:hypothetical protein